jgi:4-amino-4-deoxy-L-arabinose transferase-like glycosyltransferase
MLKPIPKSVLLCFLCACWVLPGLFNHEPWKADEPYTFGIVHHILQTGDWVVPTVAGEPFMEKPPLYYLSAAFFARLFSPLLPPHDGARLASGFFLLLAFLFAGLAGRKLWGKGQGVTTVALLLGSVGLVLNAHQLITDTALFAGCSIAIFGLILSEERPIAGGLWLGFGVGIGFLSKGLLAPAAFGLASLLLPALYPSWRTRRYALCLGVALLAAVPFLTVWPIALYLRSPALFRDWLWVNNFGRFFGFVHLGPRKTGTYLLLLLSFAFPAYLLAGWALWRKARGGRREMTSIAVPLVVFLVMLAVLELASDGRDLYALPLLLPLSILAASVVPTLPRWSSAILDRLGMAVFLVVILTLWVGWFALNTGNPVALAGWLHRTHPAYIPSFRPLAFVFAILFTGSWLLLALVPRISGNPDGERAVLRWAAGTSLAWGLAMAILLPWLDAGNSYRSMMISLGKAIPPGTQEVAGISVPESPRAMLDYYIGVEVRRFDPKAGDHHDLLLVKDNPGGKENVDAGWRKIWEGARPGETKEVFRLYSRNGEPYQKLPSTVSRRKHPLKKVQGFPGTGNRAPDAQRFTTKPADNPLVFRPL